MSRKSLVLFVVLLLVCSWLLFLVLRSSKDPRVPVKSFAVAQQDRLEACLFEERIVTIRLDLGQGVNERLSVDPPDPLDPAGVRSDELANYVAIHYSENGCNPSDSNPKPRQIKWVVECTGDATSAEGAASPCLQDGDHLIIRPKDTPVTGVYDDKNGFKQRFTLFDVPTQGHFATSTVPHTLSSGLPNPDYDPRDKRPIILVWMYEIEVQRYRNGIPEVYKLDPTAKIIIDP